MSRWQGPCGCDSHAFGLVLRAEVPAAEWPLSYSDLPDTPVIFDILEFCAGAVGLPVEGDFHSYFGHSHLSWDREASLANFISDVNFLFARNGVAYELTPEGQARRLLPTALAEAPNHTEFATWYGETDRLFETARERIALPKLDDRRDALEKFWDAFERIKTLEPGRDIRSQAEKLLDGAATPGTRFRQVLGEEASALTRIGNTFRIRHSETSQEDLDSVEQVDYFFGRLFAFNRIVLRTASRPDRDRTVIGSRLSSASPKRN